MQRDLRPGELVPRPFLPLPATRRRRSSFLVQLWRFVVLNLKMTRLILLSHHGPRAPAPRAALPEPATSTAR
jgi:hypothetical protein